VRVSVCRKLVTSRSPPDLPCDRLGARRSADLDEQPVRLAQRMVALLDAACGPFESIGMPGWARRRKSYGCSSSGSFRHALHRHADW
jgi:hypothetical protein